MSATVSDQIFHLNISNAQLTLQFVILENDLLQVETEVKEMMTKTQAEYTSSGGDKAKVWDTIQKEVLVQGGERNRLFVYSTQREGIWGSIHTNQTLHQGGGGEYFFFLNRGGGNWEGLEVRFQEDGIRGWQDWKAQENANNSFHSSDCVVKEIMNFILKASFICVILRPF